MNTQEEKAANLRKWIKEAEDALLDIEAKIAGSRLNNVIKLIKEAKWFFKGYDLYLDKEAPSSAALLAFANKELYPHGSIDFNDNFSLYNSDGTIYIQVSFRGAIRSTKGIFKLIKEYKLDVDYSEFDMEIRRLEQLKQEAIEEKEEFFKLLKENT